MPHAAISLAFIFMLIVSWRRWTSPIIDSGRELDLPLRLLRGELLYRDVHYLYPPLSPYLNALLYRLFGAHLDVLLASGVVCAVVVIALCYLIARRLMRPWEAAVAAIMVIVWCVFKPAGNLISPYAFAALHGMMLALGGLLFTLRYGERQRRRELLAVGSLIGLAAITKQEFAVAAAVTVTAALSFIHRTNFKLLVSRLALVAIPAAAIALPVYGFFLRRVGWQILVADCHLFYTHLPASLVYYNAQRTGLDHPFSSLAQMLGAAAVGVAIAVAIAWLSILSATWGERSGLKARLPKMTRWCGLIFVISMACVFSLKALTHNRWDGSPLRALPLLLLGLIVAEWRRATIRKGVSPAPPPHLFITSVYSLAILARVALRVPSGGAFGGFFLPTSLILIYYLVTLAWPHALGSRTQHPRIAHRARLMGQTFLGVLLFVTAVVFAVRYRANYNFEVTAPRGRLYTTRPVGQAMHEAIDFITARTAPDEAIAVLPEGSDLAFLSGRRMPLRLQIFLPGFLDEPGERDEIRRLQQAPVRYLLIVNRPVREFGAEALGRDYFPTLGRWIEEHYRLALVCGIAHDHQLQIGDPAFFIKIYAAHDAP